MKTTILLARHEVHGKDGALKNELPPAARDRARARGKKLQEMFPPTFNAVSAYSSPQPRALQTLIEMLCGYGRLVPIQTDDRLGDLEMERINATPISEAAKRLGISVEEMCLRPKEVYPDLPSIMLHRAKVGADSLKEIAQHHPDQVVFVSSHGGAKTEIAILSLKNPNAKKFEDIGQPVQMFATGQIAKLVIDSATGELLEEEYLDL